MSASDPNSSIFMTDTPNQIKNKINRHGFSGGQETEEEHRRLGGDPDVDVSYQYLSFFLDDDEELAKMAEVRQFFFSFPFFSFGFADILFVSCPADSKDYRAGRLLTSQMKSRCIKLLQDFVGDFQAVRFFFLSRIKIRKLLTILGGLFLAFFHSLAKSESHRRASFSVHGFQ